MKKLLIVLSAALMLAGCKKDNTSPSVPCGPSHIYVHTDISLINGNTLYDSSQSVIVDTGSIRFYRGYAKFKDISFISDSTSEYLKSVVAEAKHP